MANEAETSSNQSWRRRLDDRWNCRDHARVGRHSRPGALSESELPADSLIPGPKCRLERLDIRSMDSAVCYQYPRRGTVLARLYPAASGGSLGTRSMVGKRHSVVPVPLESRLADRRDVAADHADAPVGCAAEAEHYGGHHHSRGIQRRRLRPRHQRARRSLGSSDMIANRIDDSQTCGLPGGDSPPNSPSRRPSARPPATRTEWGREMSYKNRLFAWCICHL